MSKLAIFVEGYTEVVFVEKLIQEMIGADNVRIEHREIRGGSTVRRTNSLVKAARPDTGQQYFVLIYDCGSDEQVKTRIRQEHENLTRGNYIKIIGIRDVRPTFTHAEIPRLEQGLRLYIKTALIPVEFILAILEIEAWFLAEVNHFPIIDPAITVPAIIAALGFDPANDDMEQRLTPTTDLNDCYAIGGKTYTKQTSAATVAALDFAVIYVDLWRKFNYLERVIRSLEAFFA